MMLGIGQWTIVDWSPKDILKIISDRCKCFRIWNFIFILISFSMNSNEQMCVLCFCFVDNMRVPVGSFTISWNSLFIFCYFLSFFRLHTYCTCVFLCVVFDRYLFFSHNDQSFSLCLCQTDWIHVNRICNGIGTNTKCRSFYVNYYYYHRL